MLRLSTIHCFDPSIRSDIIEHATSLSLKTTIFVKNPHRVDIFINEENQEIHDCFLAKYENDPSVGILYRKNHPKNICSCDPTPIQIPSIKSPDGITGSQYTTTYAKYYNFPPYVSPVGQPPIIGVYGQNTSFLQSDIDKLFSTDPNLIGIAAPNVIGWGVWSYENETGPIGPAGYESDAPLSIESSMDIQIVASVCPAATIYFFQSPGTSPYDYYYAIDAAVDQNCCVLSFSWVLSETIIINGIRQTWSNNIIQITDSQLTNAVSQGTTVVCSSGDQGCYFPIPATGTNLPIPPVKIFNVCWPACSPNVVSVGGTSVASGGPETAWLDKNGGYSGGGQALYTIRPLYQQNVQFKTDTKVPVVQSTNPVYNTNTKYLPDVSFNADATYRYYHQNKLLAAGGTSASAPLLAGLVALIYALSPEGSIPKTGYAPNGLNYFLYSAPSNCFNDITIGGNDPYSSITTGTVTRALTGYDLSTGLGTINGSVLLNYLSIVTCVDGNTYILMADETCKQIKKIKEGEMVAGGMEYPHPHKYKVEKVIKTLVTPDTVVEIVRFPKNYFQQGVPEHNLNITSIHPIYYNKIENTSSFFKQCEHIKASECLTAENGFYYLYDLQFSHEGSYVAEGLVVKSRSPFNDIYPLGNIKSQ